MQSLLKEGAILIISGPSGCGKSSLLKEVYKTIDNYYFSISTTTRQPRDGEKDGIDYFFVSKEEFEQDIQDGHFLEYAKVHNNYYGTSLKPIIKSLNEGKLVIFDIDVQGHRIVKQKLNNISTSVFITTPTIQDLEQRLTNRNTDTKDVIKTRLQNAQIEIEQMDKYDYFIVNDNLQEASSLLTAVAKSAQAKTKLFDADKIVGLWKNESINKLS
jgi:guanylate kinase